jgi:glucose/arabinose dehydrogenase
MRGRLRPGAPARSRAALRVAALALAAAGCSDGASASRDAGSGSGPRRDAGLDAGLDGGLAGCAVTRGREVRLAPVARISGAAVLVTSPPGDARLFVVGQEGQLWIVRDGQLQPTPFLDLGIDAGGPVVADLERGLLGLAFHPRYAQNRTFFVFYTTATANVLARYRARADDPGRADPSSGEVVLSIADPLDTHNGGMIEFGPEGLLTVGTGDGGGAHDPFDHAQNPRSLLGKLLRLDVDHPADGRPYGIPAGNPFADGVAGAPEIFAMGLRNPWRWSFDDNGDLYLTDVGQATDEELQVIAAGTGAGANFGWPIYEGHRCNRPGGECAPDGMTFPQLTKSHATHFFCSIIGGDVYRGGCYPDLVGRYFFSDYCYGGVRSLRYHDDDGDGVGVVSDERFELGAGAPQVPTSLHAAAGGELYLTTTQGHVLHLEAGE